MQNSKALSMERAAKLLAEGNTVIISVIDPNDNESYVVVRVNDGTENFEVDVTFPAGAPADIVAFFGEAAAAAMGVLALAEEQRAVSDGMTGSRVLH